MNTSRWLQNGIFGNPEKIRPELPPNGTPGGEEDYREERDELKKERARYNPVVPPRVIIPNPRQDCFCGKLVNKSAIIGHFGKGCIVRDITTLSAYV